MAKVWSFNTTVRNPERLENMLRALKKIEGQEFDLMGQRAFFGKQIELRFFKPTKELLGEEDLISAVYKESAEDLPEEIVERILKKYDERKVDASARGRTTAGPLNRFGLCIALKSRGPVVITDLGNKWLDRTIEDNEFFTKFLLKWQYPNPIEAGYEDFNIRPFIATISLIKEVNKQWEVLGNSPVGLSKREYALFVPTLTHHSQVPNYAKRIVEFRSQTRGRADIQTRPLFEQLVRTRIHEVFNPDEPLAETQVRKLWANLRDYADSSVRYFRISGLVIKRGRDTHIDLAPERVTEISKTLEAIPATATEFTYDGYKKYLVDSESVSLPWETPEDLARIGSQLVSALQEEGEILENFDTAHFDAESINTLRARLDQARMGRLKDLRYNLEVLDDCLTKLRSLTSDRYEVVTTRPSLDFEWYVSRAMMVLNGAIDIAPSFKMGDDGIPTGFRPNLPDIECYYKEFGLTVEVTLLRGRDQSFAEGQPVSRHLRDFEIKSGLQSYCIFVAPLLHRDTLNMFWIHNKFMYEGARQRIVPLTLPEFIRFLELARKRVAAKRMAPTNIRELLDSIYSDVDQFNTVDEWRSIIPKKLAKWDSL